MNYWILRRILSIWKRFHGKKIVQCALISFYPRFCMYNSYNVLHGKSVETSFTQLWNVLPTLRSVGNPTVPWIYPWLLFWRPSHECMHWLPLKAFVVIHGTVGMPSDPCRLAEARWQSITFLIYELDHGRLVIFVFTRYHLKTMVACRQNVQ